MCSFSHRLKATLTLVSSLPRQGNQRFLKSPSPVGAGFGVRVLGRVLRKSLVSSDHSLGEKGVLVQHQYPSSSTVCEREIPALSEHWLSLPLRNSAQLTQRCDDRRYASFVQHSIFTLCDRTASRYFRTRGLANK